jgi:hypothetical protein
VFEEVDDNEYEERQDKRRNDDFIVDDDGFGYRDHGGEIWEVSDAPEDGGKKKKRKLDVSIPLTLIKLICSQMNRASLTSCSQ